MREFERKRKVRKILASPWTVVPLLALLFFLVRGTWGIYLKDRESAAQLKLAEDRLVRLQDRETQLSSATDRLSTESGVEQEIRDRLQMVKEGEHEVVILDADSGAPASVPPSPGFLQKIWNFFTIR